MGLLGFGGIGNHSSFVKLLMRVSSKMCLLASLNNSAYLGFRNSNVTKYISFFLNSFPTLVGSADVGFIAGVLRLKRPLLLLSSLKHAEQYGHSYEKVCLQSSSKLPLSFIRSNNRLTQSSIQISQFFGETSIQSIYKGAILSQNTKN